jgi:hypothetical protein
VVLIAAVLGGLAGVFTATEAAAVGAVLAFAFASAADATHGPSGAHGPPEHAMICDHLRRRSSATSSRCRRRRASDGGDPGDGVPPLTVIVLLLLMYIILGAVFDEVAAMVITMPFVLPLIKSLGYDPVWWGIINVVICELGMIVPPIGINVFVIHGLARDIPLTQIYRGVAPFVFADTFRLAVLVLFPALTTRLGSAVQLRRRPGSSPTAASSRRRACRRAGSGARTRTARRGSPRAR